MSVRDTDIGYLLRMYPRYSQTFIVNEILELERQETSLRIGSLRLPNEGVFHESISRVRAPVDYLEPRRPSGRRDETRPGTLAAAMRRALPHDWTCAEECSQAEGVVRWAAKRRIGHVHVHFGTSEATVALLASRFGGPSYSLTLHAFDIFRDNVNRALLAQKINGSHFTVTVCESNRRFLVDNVPGVDPERIRVNYNGVDLQLFHPNGQTRDPLRVLAVGRLIEKKGFIHLIRAIDSLRRRNVELRCDIIGEGRERGALEAEIRARGLSKSVRLTGPATQDVVREHLAHAGQFVLPCIEARDGNVDALPTVLLEALAAGCPAVSTCISGVPEIIESSESGMLVAPGDEAGLADAMYALATKPELSRRVSVAGRLRAEERFDVRRNVAHMRRWLLEAAGLAATGSAPDQPAALRRRKATSC